MYICFTCWYCGATKRRLVWPAIYVFSLFYVWTYFQVLLGKKNCFICIRRTKTNFVVRFCPLIGIGFVWSRFQISFFCIRISFSFDFSFSNIRICRLYTLRVFVLAASYIGHLCIYIYHRWPLFLIWPGVTIKTILIHAVI